MGQEIGTDHFERGDFEHFRQRLEGETALLSQYLEEGVFSARGPITGFELEAWLVDAGMKPLPINGLFLEAFDDELASPELAKFNVEFNNNPLPVTGNMLARMRADLESVWARAQATAESLGARLVAIGTLPTLEEGMLHLGNISALKRYRALNEQILACRGHQPLHLDIAGREILRCRHRDVMLEAATTSFQIHLQVPAHSVRRYFNASLLAAAPLVAVSANSPFLFGRDLWAETRIPLFEQAVAVGGADGAAAGPLHRVSFGTGYVRTRMDEPFEENLWHFPILLPTVTDDRPEHFAHLRLHNGTIWRWIRPLVGFDPDGTPHIRIEQRVLPAGPSIADMVANAAFYYGLVESLAGRDAPMPFAEVRDNFYQAARYGLAAPFNGLNGRKSKVRAAILDTLLPLASEGLARLGLSGEDGSFYLGIVENRAASGQTGSEWQRRFVDEHPGCFADMIKVYLALQSGGEPVHQWPI